MPSNGIGEQDLRGVFAVPPLPRSCEAGRAIDFDNAERVTAHIVGGGITRLLYGGNAFLYHVTLSEYAALLDWLSGFEADRWPIPSVGPSFGRAMDQACLLRRHRFRCAMALPCSDPRDADGMERGLRDFTDAAGLPLIIYLKSDDAFGADRERAVEAIGRLMDDGSAVAIKYAIVRRDPSNDPWLEALLRRVDRRRVISGMGERPAIVHLRDARLGGLTTGSGCIAPAACSRLFQACKDARWTDAEQLRQRFMPLEDLRDAWGPARVLHHATELAGVADCGPILPFQSPLDPAQLDELAPVARALRNLDS
jgi:dihydrodipicolinate synthase/N-acetylneuraminate lyase